MSETRATTLRTDLCGTLRAGDAGRRVSVCGWVARRREHGEHLAFIDLRDHTGLVQCVVDGDQDLRSEYVARITGVVRPRPVGTGERASSNRHRVGALQPQKSARQLKFFRQTFESSGYRPLV